jgi:hypothetical protein
MFWMETIRSDVWGDYRGHWWLIRGTSILLQATAINWKTGTQNFGESLQEFATAIEQETPAPFLYNMRTASVRDQARHSAMAYINSYFWEALRQTTKREVLKQSRVFHQTPENKWQGNVEELAPFGSCPTDWKEEWQYASRLLETSSFTEGAMWYVTWKVE